MVSNKGNETITNYTQIIRKNGKSLTGYNKFR